ncbi:cytochrome c maturation protein CcmE [Sorangium sp. So ce375]|uniref:cytochrome c maturation protein CcmE n=1 Tax=Sorangium sp. So ce375 TaxID=3133306 RepID=UPI003F5B83A8
MSKKLDDELAHALSLAEQQDTPAVVKPATASPAPKAHRPRSLGLLATLLVMVGALVALFLVGFKEAAVYATPVDQLLASKDKLAGRKVRVEGELVPGTLVKRDSPCEYRFQIHGTQAALPVRYAQCVIPDTFRDVPSGGVQVTVEGALSQAGDFEASLVMAKCTSKYDPNSHEMKGGAQPAAGPLSLN